MTGRTSIPPIDNLTFPPIGGTFFRIQYGSKPLGDFKVGVNTGV
jgi:hypothetical protein